MKFENTVTSNWKGAFHGLRHPLESYKKSDSEFGITQCYGDETVDMEDKWLEKKNSELHKEYYSSEWKDYTEKEYIKQCEEIGDWLWKNGVIQGDNNTDCFEYAFLGPNDMDLAQRMIKAGTPNDKFLRQIFVSVDITAPLYWWKEMDQYKVGTVTDSTSTMHKLASTPITRNCFEMDDYDGLLKMYDREPYNIDDYVDDMWDSVIDYCETLRKRYLETKDQKYWKELIRLLPESWLQTRTWTANYSVLRNIYHWRKDHRLTEWHTFCNWISQLPYANELILFEN